ncbi:hypothetical protein [Legionella fallonii]|uniref:Uncharacterized protein n=1 Tax=Legionella fallonii LLAP-10 TaxID=1212491 RepID=A0A098G5R9_9GAMM|nr:hypothetical protein [Legionella fallonii]CEG57319.1 protein of unknown function [Legionella fallonii LLAP-10]
MKRVQTIIATRKLKATSKEAFFTESKLCYPRLLTDYGLPEGELASEKISATLSKIHDDQGKQVALEVTNQLKDWAIGNKKEMDINGITISCSSAGILLIFQSILQQIYHP